MKLALDERADVSEPDRDDRRVTPWREARFGGLRQPLTMLQLGVGVMLLLLCVNLAVLLLARTNPGRERSAVLTPGENRRGVVLTESLMLSLGGGVIGALVTWLGLPALRALTPRVLPRLDEVTFDSSVFVFFGVLCVLTGLVLGTGVAVSRPDREGITKLSGRVWRASRRDSAVALLAVQMALAFMLLAGAGLAIQCLSICEQGVGINPSGLLSFDVHLPRDPYVTPNVAQVGSIEIAEYSPAGAALYDRIHLALKTMPGVVQSAGVGTPPFTAAPFVQFWIGDQEQTPDNQIAAQYLAITENYFNTMGIRVIRGRDFSPADRPDSPWVILVNEALARQHWPAGDAIGQKLTLTFHPNDGEPSREIVGLVADTLPFRGASEVPPLIYLLHRQQATRQRASLEGRRTVMSFVARTTGDPLALGEHARELVGKVDVTTPVTSIRTVESYLNDGQVRLLQFAATLLGVFALVALVTSAVGIYGFTAYGVTHVAACSRWRSAPLRPSSSAQLGFSIGRRLDGVIAPFLTNLTVRHPIRSLVSPAVALATALVACLVPALRATRSGR